MEIRISPSKQTLTYQNLEEIKMKIQEDPFGSDIIYIVPDQMILSVEQELFIDTIENEVTSNQNSLLHAFSRLRLYPMKRLSDFLMIELGLPKEMYLTDNALDIHIASLLWKEMNDKASDIHTLEGKDVFPRQFQTQFLQEITKVIKELLNNHIQPNDFIKELSTSHTRISEYTSKKLQFIARVYQSVFESLQTDSGYQIQMNDFPYQIRQSHYIKDCVIYIDGFSSFNNLQYEILKALEETAQNVIITLPIEEEVVQKNEGRTSLFYQAKITYDTLKLHFPHATCDTIQEINRFIHPDLEQLFTIIYHPEQETIPSFLSNQSNIAREGISLFRYETKEDEIEGTLLYLQYMNKVQGISYSDMSIIASNLTEYKDICIQKAQRLNIPLFLDQIAEISYDPLLTFVTVLLRCIRKNEIILQDMMELVDTNLFVPKELMYVDSSMTHEARVEQFRKIQEDSKASKHHLFDIENAYDSIEVSLSELLEMYMYKEQKEALSKILLFFEEKGYWTVEECQTIERHMYDFKQEDNRFKDGIDAIQQCLLKCDESERKYYTKLCLTLDEIPKIPHIYRFLQEDVVKGFEILFSSIQKGSSSQEKQAAFLRFLSEYHIFENYEHLLHMTAVQSLDDEPKRDIQKNQIQHELLSEFQKIMEELERYNLQDLDTEAWVDYISIFIEKIEFRKLPNEKHALHITDIDRSRLIEARIVCMIGQTDRDVPNVSQTSYITDEEKVFFETIQLPFSESIATRIKNYDQLLYKCITTATQTLLLSYPRTKGKEIVLPSKLFSTIDMYLCGAVEHIETLSFLPEAFFTTDMNTFKTYMLRFISEHYQQKTHPKHMRQLMSSYAIQYPEDVAKIDANYQMKAPTIEVSHVRMKNQYTSLFVRENQQKTLGVTSIESYLSCSYRFFIESVLNIRRPQENINHARYGTFIHYLLEQYMTVFYGKFSRAYEHLKTREGQKELTFRIHHMIRSQGILQEIYPKTLNSFYRTVERGFLHSIQYFATIEEQYTGTLYKTEYTIERDFMTNDGNVKIVGKIDRIDVDTAGRLYCIDYKTGKVHFSNHEIVAEGKYLQLPYYLSSLQKEMNQKIAGYSYIALPKIHERFAHDDITAYQKILENSVYISGAQEIINKGKEHAKTTLRGLFDATFDAKFPMSVLKKQCDEQDFITHLNHVEDILHQAVSNIMAGQIDRNPSFQASNEKESVCTYCPFQGVCKIEKEHGIYPIYKQTQAKEEEARDES